VGALAEPADREPATLPDLGHHERQVQEPVDRVVADQQRAIAGPVLDVVELVLDDPAQGLEQRHQLLDRALGGELRDLDRIVGHGVVVGL
jgi:hypothetical protein